MTNDDFKQAALEYHRLSPPGKIKVAPTKPMLTQRDLALAYSPGVAYACEAIVENPTSASELTARGIMHKKGFPESYDIKALLGFLDAVKSGRSASAPIYSHLAYDVTGEQLVVDRPDVLIVEGVNVLDAGTTRHTVVSDYFDFSIYVDAPEPLIRTWFLERFHRLRTTAFRDPASYFHRYAAMTDSEANAFAEQVWETINAVNLRENIAPTRDRAMLVLEKGPDHRIKSVALQL